MNKFNQPIGEPILPKFKGEIGVLIGTGPSITSEQIEFIRSKKCRVFTVNNAYQLINEADVHVSCNNDWWEYYWPKDKVLRTMPATKYTWYQYIANQYNITYIKAIVKDGLSTDPRIIHINHGSSPMGINIAVHYGIKKLLLIGHDMKFSPDYNGRAKKVGSKSRHFFGEYPKELQHFPSVKVGLSSPGVLDGLIEAYKKMIPDLRKMRMEVINCTPKSALKCFPLSTLEKEL